MFENFKRLPQAEQDRILTICLEEFAQHGFQRASTNTIVARAGIPKGTLFFYFGSKKDLCLYLLDTVIARFTAWIKERASDPPDDLFERLLENHRVKMEFVIKEPLAYQFLYNTFVNMPPELKDDLASRIPQYTSLGSRNLLQGLDPGWFREGVDPVKAVQLIHLMLEGIFAHHLPRFSRMGPDESLKLLDELTEEVKEYFELIKHGIYHPTHETSNDRPSSE